MKRAEEKLLNIKKRKKKIPDPAKAYFNNIDDIL